MARKQQHNISTASGLGDYTSETDKMLAGIDPSDLKMDASSMGASIQESIFKQLGGPQVMQEMLWVVGTDAVTGALTPLASAVATATANGLGKIPNARVQSLVANDGMLSEDKISKGLVMAIHVARPAIDAGIALRNDMQRRKAFNEWLEPSGITFSASSLLGYSGDNLLLKTAHERRFAPQFNSDIGKASLSVLTAGAIAVSRHLDTKAQKDKIEGFAANATNPLENENVGLTSKLDQLSSDDTGRSALEAQLETNQKTLQTIANDKEKAINKAHGRPLAQAVFNGKLNAKINGQTFNEEVYDHQYFNPPFLTLGATAVISGKIKKDIKNSTRGVADVLALDLAMYFVEEWNRGAVRGDEIDIQKFVSRNPQHKFHNPHLKGEVKLADFIEEIFHQHIRDQHASSGVDCVSERYKIDLEYACSALSDAFTGRDMSDTTLSPYAILEAVGKGVFVSHDGFGVAGEHLVETEIDALRERFPCVYHVDAANYIMNMGTTSQELSALYYDELPEHAPDAAAAMTLLLPTSVLTEGLNPPLTPEEAKAGKASHKSEVLDLVEAVVRDQNLKSDRELKEDRMSPAEIRQLRSALKSFDKGDVAGITSQLHDPQGLRSALLINMPYWRELADKGMDVGEMSAHKSGASKKKDAPATTVSEAESEGRVSEKEKEAAR